MNRAKKVKEEEAKKQRGKKKRKEPKNIPNKVTTVAPENAREKRIVVMREGLVGATMKLSSHLPTSLLPPTSLDMEQTFYELSDLVAIAQSFHFDLLADKKSKWTIRRVLYKFEPDLYDVIRIAYAKQDIRFLFTRMFRFIMLGMEVTTRVVCKTLPPNFSRTFYSRRNLTCLATVLDDALLELRSTFSFFRSYFYSK